MTLSCNKVHVPVWLRQCRECCECPPVHGTPACPARALHGPPWLSFLGTGVWDCWSGCGGSGRMAATEGFDISVFKPFQF